jgi:hypothetical protein
MLFAALMWFARRYLSQHSLMSFRALDDTLTRQRWQVMKAHATFSVPLQQCFVGARTYDIPRLRVQ